MADLGRPTGASPPESNQIYATFLKTANCTSHGCKHAHTKRNSNTNLDHSILAEHPVEQRLSLDRLAINTVPLDPNFSVPDAHAAGLAM